MGFHTFLAALAVTVTVTRAAVPSIDGFSVTWSDDFEGTGLPSSTNWQIDTGTSYPGGAANWGTGEIQTYTNDQKNLKVTGGNLQITALKDSTGSWTSARIETQRKDFMAQPGGKMRIQASLSLPNIATNQAIGYWPAFWTLGASFRGNFQNWPSIGEFDIMENVNGINRLFGTLHCGVSPGGPCDETTGISSNTTCTGCNGAFHTYAFEVDRTQSVEALRWYLDGSKYKEILSTTLTAEVFSQVAHNPHFILLNLAMGGVFPNNVHGATTPLSNTVSGGVFQAEYVAVYNSDGSGGNTTSTSTTATRSTTSTSTTATRSRTSTSTTATRSTTSTSRPGQPGRPSTISTTSTSRPGQPPVTSSTTTMTVLGQPTTLTTFTTRTATQPGRPTNRLGGGSGPGGRQGGF